MKKRLNGALAFVLLAAVIAVFLTGCGDFRQQALQAQERIDDALQQAEIAEDAATRNAGLIIDLEHRIDALEAALAELQGTKPND